MRRLLTLAAFIAALAAAGCAGRTGTAQEITTPAFDHPSGAADVVVEVGRPLGGFVPQDVAFDTRPLFRLYGDGTVLLAADGDGLIPAVRTYRLTEEGIQAVLEAAAGEGLLAEPPDYGTPSITDVGTTPVRITTGGQSFVHEAYALEFQDEIADTLTPAQREARARLRGFIEFVSGVAAARPELLATRPTRYTPVAMDVQGWETPDGSGGAALDWPLPTPLSADCVTLAGDSIAELERAVGGASPPIDWRSEGRIWSAGMRLVLPGERGCTDQTVPRAIPSPAARYGFPVPEGEVLGLIGEGQPRG